MAYRSLAEAITRGKGRERSFRCPKHDDRTASASVNVAKGWWVCYVCGAKGTTDGVLEEADERFLDDVNELLGEPVRVYPEAWLDQFDAGPVHPYWLGRFSEEAARHFRLGYDHARVYRGEPAPSPCYPMRASDGTVLGVVYRNLAGEPKYQYPRGCVKSELLFNYSPQALDCVALVEGAMDAVACWEVGHPAFALYGSILHRQQLVLLQRTGAKRVIMATDNDKAGWRAIDGWTTDEGIFVPGLEHQLTAAGFEAVRPDWQRVEAKDVAELDRDTRKTLLDLLAL